MAVGAAKATEHLVGLVRGAWKHFLRPRRWLLSRYARPDVEPWVVISGKLGLIYSLGHQVVREILKTILFQFPLALLGISCLLSAYWPNSMWNIQETFNQTFLTT